MKLELIRPQSVGRMRRVGSKNDGGYVIPENFPEIKTIVSFGLGDNWSFEKQLLEEGFIDEFVFYDHTVSFRSLFLRTTRRLSSRNFKIDALAYRVLILFRYFVDFKVKRFRHVSKEITQFESTKVKTNLIEVADNVTDSQFFLKVDIEGDEYFLVDQIIKTSARIPLMIIEFHNTELKRVEFEDAILKLKEFFIICHVHPNNFEPLSSDGIPIAMEITFGRKDVYPFQGLIDFLPIQRLDAPSSANRDDHEISFL
jgi:hypothetical protein